MRQLHSKVLLVVLSTILVAVGVQAAESGAHSTDPAKSPYSPYVENEHPTRVYWGDTHLHTSYSTDAGMVGCTIGPEEAYRLALGETITSSTGQPVRLVRPYDFLVVADHSENLGLAPMIAASDPLVLKNEVGKLWHDMVKAGKGNDAFADWIARGSTTGTDPINSPEMMCSAWEYIVKAAEKYNDPGRFTAFIGYEWTATPNGNNLHRNVVFRDGGDRAGKVIPYTGYDSTDPEMLWKWMQSYEDQTGGRVLAIPHNGNVSGGMMWMTETMAGKPFDRAYAKTRALREPIIEITQPKGTSETHPTLSPEDEYAGFEIWDKSNLGGNTPTTPDMYGGSYARAALKNGLTLEQQLGTNPFKFGVIGSTDSHTGLSTAGENNFFGKTVSTEPSAERWEHAAIPAIKPELVTRAWELGASGLAAVWAKENTRESLFDAMERKEVYGTTGTRMTVRVFGGWDFGAADCEKSDFAQEGYRRGVPMGGDLREAKDGKVPTFIIRAMKDIDGANLDRVQVIKGWLSEDGQQHEKIYDVAVSDGRRIDANGRCSTPVGNTVDVAKASYTNSIGAAVLSAFWKDPEFDPKARAFYYVRVIEIPTPRWTAFDAKYFGIKMPDEVPMSLQERAYTSPIWYTPAGGA